MLVLDASAVVEWLLGTARGRLVGARHAADPGPHQTLHLMDIEVVNALRKLSRSGSVTEAHAGQLVSLLPDVPLDRHTHGLLMPRAWELRHNVSASDAAYVALAEILGATLITGDARLAAAPGVRARVELV